MIEFAAGLVLTQFLFARPEFDINPRNLTVREAISSGQYVANLGRTVPGMEVQFTTAGDGLVRIYGHVAFQIERFCEEYDDRFMVQVDVIVDGRLRDMISENFSKYEHYHDTPFNVAVPIGPGQHEVVIRARKRFIPLKDGARGKSEECWVFYKQSGYQGMYVEVYE
jgi:hypothetical protein